MKKANWRDKLRYRFDNLMAKGTGALVGLLFGITLLVVAVTGVLAALLNGAADGSVGKAMWMSLMHALDAGTLAGDEGNVGFIVLMALVTVCGIFITSMLIGILNTGLESKMESLRRGKSRVLEKDHVVILGFNEGAFTIVSELVAANENQRRAAVVIMDDCDKSEMEEAFAQRIPDSKTTRIICRSGQVAQFADLEICSLADARSIIINTGEDFETIKAVLAVTNLLKRAGTGKSVYMVAVIHDEANIDAARIAGEGYAEILHFKDIIARVMAHTCRQPGLSSVFVELFGYGGDEIYIEHIPGAVGKRMDELCCLFAKSTVLGLERGGQSMLNPPADTIVQPDDDLILIAEDDGVSVPLSAPAPADKTALEAAAQTAVPEQPQHMLVLGCNELLPSILEEEDHYMPAGSHVTVAAPAELLAEDCLINTDVLQALTMDTVACDLYDYAALQKLLTPEIENVLVLSGGAEDAEQTDAKTLLLLLYLRDLARKTGYEFTITSEMQSVQNQELARVTRVNDFVISSNITNLIVTQISQKRELRAVFEDLLDADGSEIYMKPAVAYVPAETEVSLYTVAAAAAARGEVFIGYKKQGAQGEFTVTVNPEKAQSVRFGAQDKLIVIAED